MNTLILAILWAFAAAPPPDDPPVAVFAELDVEAIEAHDLGARGAGEGHDVEGVEPGDVDPRRGPRRGGWCDRFNSLGT